MRYRTETKTLCLQLNMVRVGVQQVTDMTWVQLPGVVVVVVVVAVSYTHLTLPTIYSV